MDLNRLEEWHKAQRGELYRAFVPELVAARDRCYMACHRFNTTSDLSRRNLVKLWREITQDPTPLPPPLTASEPSSATSSTAAATTATPLTTQEGADLDAEQFSDSPWILPPLHADYGINVHISPGTFVNYNASFVDTCPITIGKRVLIGPNCSFYSGTHPIQPEIRNGMEGPELGKPISVGDDCWFGGNVVVLPGVTIGNGCTIGAGSVVTRDVPDRCVVAGNPARVLRRVEPPALKPETNVHKINGDGGQNAVVVGTEDVKGGVQGPEQILAEDAVKMQQIA